MIMRAIAFGLAVLGAPPVLAQQVRDTDIPLIVLPGFDQERLIGEWYEVAQTPTLLQRDCHGTTVSIQARDDSRLTISIACHVGAVEGPVLPIEGILAETDPGVFLMRLVRFSALGSPLLVVLWQSEDGGLVVLGSPAGQIGWIWARSAPPDPASLEEARQALISNGYRASAIRDVEHAP